MSRVDKLYQQLSLAIIEQGYWYDDKSREKRCKQLTSLTMDFDLQMEFPLLTTKKMNTNSIVTELLWFLRGDDNIKYLLDNNVNIWNKDAYNWYKKRFPVSKTTLEDFPQEVIDYVGNYNNVGDVGRNYGVQWRRWRGIEYVQYAGDHTNTDYPEVFAVDQIYNLIKGLKDNPMSRRHIVTAWNPAELEETALPPCHWSFEILPRPLYEFEKEIYSDKEYGFTLKWHQRSVDTFLGLPFNIASYGLLAKIIEELTGYIAIGLIGDLSNVHFYEPHIDLARTQLKNDPNKYKGPNFKFSEDALFMFEKFRKGLLSLNGVLENLKPLDFIFENYKSYSPIKAEMYEPNNNTTNTDSMDSSGD